MDNLYFLPEIWLPAVAVLIPLVASFAVHPESEEVKGNNARLAVALVASVAVTILEAVTAGQGFQIESLAVSGIVAVIGFLMAYNKGWKRLDINERVAPSVGVKL